MDADLAVAIIKRSIAPQHLNQVQEVVLRLSWAKQSYEQIAKDEGYDYDYIKCTGAGLWKLLSQALGRKVTKWNIERTIAELERERQQELRSDLPLDRRLAFYGREAEQAQISNWLVQENCRVVVVWGSGGIGKTSLTLRIAYALRGNFQATVWRSLLNAPPLTDVVGDTIVTLQEQLGIRTISPPVPALIEERLAMLFGICQQYRCAIVLDNYESILQGGVQTGQYRSGYEDYGAFLKQFGQGLEHQSCIAITSREKPMEVGQMEGINSPVRTLHLRGLDVAAGQQIFIDRGCRDIALDRWQEIDRYYGGNPLALQIFAAAIVELAGGDVNEIYPFLQSAQMGFPDINLLLECQWERMTPAEHQVMYWLAISRQSMTVRELENHLQPCWNDITTVDNPLTPPPSLLSVLRSLYRRSAIQQLDLTWYLQPVWIEYVTSQLVATMSAEIVSNRPRILETHAIVQAIAPEYIRQSQLRTIVAPMARSLESRFIDRSKIKAQIDEILDRSRQQHRRADGYGYLGGNLLNLALALELDLTGTNFQSLTIQQAYLVGRQLHRLDFRHAHFDRCAFTQVFSNVLAIAYSADGAFLASSDNNGQVRLWRTSDWQCPIVCTGHAAWVRQLCFSPDGKYLASAADDRTIRLWDTTDGSCLRIIGAGQVSFGVSFSPDGRYITSGSVEGKVYVWQTETGVLAREFSGHTNWVLNVCFHPHSDKIISGSADGTARIWDLESGECEGILDGHQTWVTAANYSRDGKSIVTASLTGQLRLWQVEPYRCRQVLTGHEREIWGARFSPDGKYLASAGEDRIVRLWRTSDGACLHHLTGHTKQIWCLAFHPDGRTLATGGDDRSIRIWQVEENKCLQVFSGHQNWVRAAAWTADGEGFITTSWDGAVYLWSRHHNAEVARLQGHAKSVTAVACDPLGHTWASGSEDRKIRLWDAIDRHRLEIFTGHLDTIWGLAYSPDGKYLASSGIDRSVRLWDLEKKQCRQIWSGHSGKVNRVVFHPAQPWIASASEDTTVKIWQIDRAEPLFTLSHADNAIVSVSFHPHGRYLASGGMDSKIWIWDLEDGTNIDRPVSGEGWILDLTYSPDGRYLVVARANPQIEIWDAVSLTLLRTLDGHQNWVRSVAVSPCSRYLLSASDDETARLWDLVAGELLSVHRPQQPYTGTNISGATGMSTATIENLQLLGAIHDDRLNS